MRRTDTDGWTIRSLRTYATEYKIPGRSKMTGPELLAAVRAVWTAQRVELENVLLAGGPVTVGTVLEFTSHPDCVIRATSEPNITNDDAVFVYGEYISLCTGCFGNRAGTNLRDLEYVNRMARGTDNSAPYRFFFHTMSHVTAPAAVTTTHDTPVKTIGEMSTVERTATIARATARFQAELRDAAPRIGEVLSEMSHGERTAVMYRAAQRRHSGPGNSS